MCWTASGIFSSLHYGSLFMVKDGLNNYARGLINIKRGRFLRDRKRLDSSLNDEFHTYTED